MALNGEGGGARTEDLRRNSGGQAPRLGTLGETVGCGASRLRTLGRTVQAPGGQGISSRKLVWGLETRLVGTRNWATLSTSVSSRMLPSQEKAGVVVAAVAHLTLS